MPNTRILLWAALAAILFYNYEAWMHDYPATGTTASQTASGPPGAAGTLGDSVPQAASTALPAAPAATQAPPPAGAVPAAPDSFAAPPAGAVRP